MDALRSMIKAYELEQRSSPTTSTKIKRNGCHGDKKKKLLSIDLNQLERYMQSKGETFSLHHIRTFGSAGPEARAFHLALILLVRISSIRESRSGAREILSAQLESEPTSYRVCGLLERE